MIYHARERMDEGPVCDGTGTRYDTLADWIREELRHAHWTEPDPARTLCDRCLAILVTQVRQGKA